MNSRRADRRNSKGVVIDKVLQMTNNLNKVHEKEDLFKNDDKLMAMVEEEDKEVNNILH